MLAPASTTEPKKHDVLVKYRIDMFVKEKFDTLHCSATKKLSPPNTTPADIEKRSEQIHKAANNDDWRKASNLLQAPLPPVPYSDKFLPIIEALHPPPQQNHYHAQTHPSINTHSTQAMIQFELDYWMRPFSYQLYDD